MSEVSSAAAEAANFRRPSRGGARKGGRPGERTQRRQADVASLREYLTSLQLGVSPTVHVNGHNFQMALVTVDFGQPLKSAKLNSEQNAEFTDRLKRLAREVLGRETVNIRVSYDSAHGVYWASVS